MARSDPSWLAVASVMAVGLCSSLPAAHAQQVNRVHEQSSRQAAMGQMATGQVATARGAMQLDDTDMLLGQMWGLDQQEMSRARVLRYGPRGAFSVENMSPVEMLGIHARNEGERRKYAEAFARTLHEDVERSLAWEREVHAAMLRIYGREAVVDFSRLPKTPASVGAADVAGVPRAQIIEQRSDR
jgi:hypothetical protein